MERKIFVISDQLILQLANLMCLAMATGTHVGDHFRLIKIEESDKMPGKLVLTPEYVEVYNKQVTELNTKVDELNQLIETRQVS